MHGNSTQRSSLAGGVGMGEKLALWCKEAKIQIAWLVLQPLLLSDNGQRKSDQLFYGWSPWRVIRRLCFFLNPFSDIFLCLSLMQTRA